MEASRSLLNNLLAILIACILIIGLATAQPAHKGEKKIELGKASKITPNLAEKITGASQEDISVIIFLERKSKNEEGKIKAQDKVASSVATKGGKVRHKYNLIDALSAKSLPIKYRSWPMNQK